MRRLGVTWMGEEAVATRRPADNVPVSRADQRLRTRTAILEACRALIQSGADVTMPAVAQAAGVSEATAYRHFPDLLSVVNEGLKTLWPAPEVALAAVASSTDPVERIGAACEALLRRVQQYQGSVRAVIAATITRPDSVARRPGFRFGLIDHALDPVIEVADAAAAARLATLRDDLAAVISAEAFFSLTDLCGLSKADAVASLARTAQTITAAAIADMR
jgi:AcrR family transcriptional regulator